MATSPYKKLKTANQGWVPYCKIQNLPKNKAFRIMGIVETNHPQYGRGQQATILSSDGKKFRTQLPGKYLASLSKEDIQVFKADIMNKKSPYMVYRETMVDNSYRIDIIEKEPEIDENFNDDSDVPEMEASLTEESPEMLENAMNDINKEKPDDSDNGDAKKSK